MTAVLRISSVNDGNVLEFEPDGPFIAFLDSMAAEWRGWLDVKTWASIEGELGMQGLRSRTRCPSNARETS
jgi:hypothetical protein